MKPNNSRRYQARRGRCRSLSGPCIALTQTRGEGRERGQATPRYCHGPGPRVFGSHGARYGHGATATGPGSAYQSEYVPKCSDFARSCYSTRPCACHPHSHYPVPRPLLSATDPFYSTCSAFKDGTTYGEDDKRKIYIQARTTGSTQNAGMNGNDVWMVEYTSQNSPCITSNAYPECTTNCAPFMPPHSPSPSCNSSARLPDHRTADLQWVSNLAQYDGGTFGIYSVQMEPEVVDTYHVDVFMLYPGGLNAFYWHNVWMIGTPDYTAIQPKIDFDWGAGPLTPLDGSAADYVSARWTGKVRQDDFSELFTIFVEADDGVRVWIDRNLIVDSWGRCCNETFGKVFLTKGHYHDIIVEYQEVTGDANIKLSWGSYSLSKRVIPASSFYFRKYGCSTPWAGYNQSMGPPDLNRDRWVPGVRIDPSFLPSKKYSYLYNYDPKTGDMLPRETSFGLTRAISGVPSPFRWQLMDVFNNSLSNRTETAGQVRITINHGPGERMRYVDLRNLRRASKLFLVGDGLYQFNHSYKWTKYVLRIEVEMNETRYWRAIDESPFLMNVEVGETVPEKSYHFGPGVSAATVGQSTLFNVVARDKNLNNQTSDGEDIRVWLKNASLPNRTSPIEAEGMVKYDDEGIYDVVYTVPRVGEYFLYVSMNGELLPNIPAVVETFPTEMHVPSTRVSSPALRSATAGDTVELSLSFFDEFGHPVSVSAQQSVTVTLVGPAPSKTQRAMSILSNVVGADSHKVRFRPTLAGNFSMHVRIAGLELVGSPSAYRVVPAAPVASKSIAEARFPGGLVRTRSGERGIRSTLYFELKDQFENVVHKDFASSTSAHLACPGGVTHFSVNYTGYLPAHTSGMHSASQILQHPGECVLRILVAGAEISNSPFNVTVAEAPIDRTQCQIEPVATSVAGVNIMFDMRIYDRFGNAIVRDGTDRFGLVDVFEHSFTTFVRGPVGSGARTRRARVVNAGNGTYQADWTPTQIGEYTTHVLVLERGRGIEGSYYSDLDATTLRGKSVDATGMQLDWGMASPHAGVPVDRWSAVWYGKLRPTSNATYRLFADISRNSGVQIWLSNGTFDSFEATRDIKKFMRDNTPVVEELEEDEGGTEVFADVGFLYTNVYYDFVVFYRDYGGPAGLKLSWQSSESPKEPIPASALSLFKNVTGSPYQTTIRHNVSDVKQITVHPMGGLRSAYDAVTSSGVPAQWDAGVTFSFAIQFRDTYQNLYLRGGDSGRLSIKLDEIYGGNTNTPTTLTDYSNGTYGVVIEPTLIGTHKLYVKLDGVDVVGSPFTVEVVNGAAVTSTSTARGDGLFNATVNKEAKFEMFIRDVESNMRTDADTVACTTTGPAALTVDVARFYGGVYRAKYTPKISGNYALSCTLNGQQFKSSTIRVVSDRASFAHTTFVIVNNTGVDATALITTYDNQNNRIRVGGHFFYAVMQETYDGDLRRGNVTDNGDGTYSAVFQLPSGHHILYLYLAEGRGIGDGLTAKYYTNPWLSGTPSLTRVDSHVDFKWGQDLVAPTASDYVSVSWEGFIRPKFAESYNFSLQADDGVRLTVDGVLVLDDWLNSASEFLGGRYNGNFSFPVANMLYSFKLEWRESIDIALCTLSWQSPSQPRQVIPQDYLHSKKDEIVGSPIRFTTV